MVVQEDKGCGVALPIQDVVSGHGNDDYISSKHYNGG